MDTPSEQIHVLHVDDDPEFGDLVATFLERVDDRFSVQTATSPEEGLATIAEATIDCVVSDFDMPRTNGIEFLEAVREDDLDLPFILFTGKGSEEIASEAISNGVTDYLQKEGGTDQYTLLANRISNAVEQVRTERELERTREYFRTILTHASDFVLIVDEDRQVEYVSPAVERVLGYTPSELDGMDAIAFIDPADEPTAIEAFETALENPGTEQTNEYRMRHADGTRRWVEIRSRNLLDDPTVEGIIVNARDVTEKKASRHKLATIIDNLPGYVYRHRYDEGWPLEFVKGSAEPVTGYTTTELTEDVTLAERIIHPDDQADVWIGVEEGLEATGNFDLSYRIITKDDQQRWIRDQGQLIEDPATGEEFLDGFITDITGRKNRERRLQETTTRLEALFDKSPDMITVLDSDGTLLDVNPRFCAELGYDESAVLGTPIWEFDALVDAADVRALLAEFDLDERREFDGRYERADGSTIPVEVHLRRIRIDDDDRFLAISHTVPDRTE